jgi:hypothetical protein
MIPMGFDFRILSTPPLPTDERVKDVVQLLKDSHAAGAAIALALASLLSHRRIRRDVAMTGEIDTKGRITGACWKNENALNMLGLRTVRANGDWDQYGQVQKEHWFMFANSLNRSPMQLTNSNEKIKM